MPDNTDYTRLLDGYTLVAIRDWVNSLLALKAPLASPTFTGTVTLPTSVKIGNLTSTGLVKYTNGTLSIDNNNYLTSHLYRTISVGGVHKLENDNPAALNFLNGTHSVQFTYSTNGLYAEINLANYKPNGSTAFLDGSNKVSTSYLPDTVLGQLQYVGTWNATSPSWPSGRTKLKGEYWICSTAGGKWPDGTTATGKSFVVGDWAIWTGAGTEADPYRWEKVDNTDAISSITLVNGDALTGSVTIPLAASNAYGLIKTGYTSSGKNYKVQLDTNGNAFVNVPWTDNDHNYYHTREYSTGLKISTGTGVSDMYVPYATASQYGVVLVAAVKTTAVTVNSLSTTAGKYYGVEMNTDGKLMVNVPWTDTKYSADNTTLSLSGTTFSIKSGYLATVATSGSYSDLSNKPTIPATNVIPVETTANKVLLSTTTSGTAAWSSWSTAGFLKTNASGVVSIDQNSYSLSNHTHTTTIATSSGTNQLTLAFGTKYAITAGGTSYVFTMPANPNTNTAHAHTAGTGLSISGSGGTSGTTTYSLKTATTSEIGGIAVGYTSSGKNYKVQLDSSGNAYVNVPWTNTTSFTITANATDGMFDITGTSGTNAVTYAVAPYASSVATSSWVSQAANYGKFYLGTERPSVTANTAQLNYNGSLQVGAFKATAADTGIFLDANYGSGGAGIVFEISTRAYCGSDSKVRIQDGTGSAIYLCVDGAPNSSDDKFINLHTYTQTEATNILNGKNSDGTTI